jgi:hypothetical protein
MILRSNFLLLTLLLSLPAGENVLAQRSQRPRTIPQRVRKYHLDEPRTRLEEFQDRLEQVIYKGFITIGAVNGRNGSAEVAAVELRSTAEPTRDGAGHPVIRVVPSER